nr:MAG TPA: PcfM DpnD/PcfM-like protein [Caudoviricetes sp.]
MSNFTIELKNIRTYVVAVEAESELDAHAKISDWIADDFESYEVGNLWQTQVVG